MKQLELPGCDKITRFTLDGVTYSAQFRKCGKPTCHCASGDPADQHGPYWYRRDALGNVGYCGRSLAPDVVSAWSHLEAQKPYLREKIEALYIDLRSLQGQIEALRLLQTGGALNMSQRLWIEAAGFRDCLVPDAARQVAQDDIWLLDNG